MFGKILAGFVMGAFAGALSAFVTTGILLIAVIVKGPFDIRAFIAAILAIPFFAVAFLAVLIPALTAKSEQQAWRRGAHAFGWLSLLLAFALLVLAVSAYTRPIPNFHPNLGFAFLVLFHLVLAFFLLTRGRVRTLQTWMGISTSVRGKAVDPRFRGSATRGKKRDARRTTTSKKTKWLLAGLLGVAVVMLGVSAPTLRMKFYQMGAKQGLAEAQYSLGVLYHKGRGVPQDYAEAVKWYRKAANQGEAFAQNDLGFMYDKGLGVPQDYAEAVKWYRKAANQDFAGSQNNLGFMYHEGLGVPRDDVQAHLWWSLAAAQGIKRAENRRDIVAKKMSPDDISKARKLAREWKPKK